MRIGTPIFSLLLASILVSYFVIIAAPGYAASITKFTMNESGTVTIAGKKHSITLALEGNILPGQKTANAKGGVNVDGSYYSISSATVKIDASAKKLSASIKVPGKGSISANMVFTDTIDPSKSSKLTAKSGTIVALLSKVTYNIRSISAGEVYFEAVESNISKISSFTIQGKPGDDVYTAIFQLQDKNQSPIASDGKIAIMIRDEKSQILYQKELIVKNGDFKEYQYTFTGSTFLAYSWTFPTSDVKSGSGFFGKAELTFTDPLGASVKSTYDFVSIPRLTDEEIQKINEDAYQKSAVPLAQTVDKGGFSIATVKAGYFNVSSFGTNKQVFRVDLAITNTGSKADYLPYDYVILDGNGNQYDKVYGGTIDFKNVYPGITIKGYQIFDPVPEGSTGLKLLITKRSYPTDYVWEFNLPSFTKS